MKRDWCNAWSPTSSSRRKRAPARSGSPQVHLWSRAGTSASSDVSVHRSNYPPDEWSEGFACFDTADYREGLRAFLNKQVPRFSGR